MRKPVNCICLILAAVLILTGCMKTVDQLYRLPKRSDEFTELQITIDEVMTELIYCAPRSGVNQQAVQMADLNGDGTDEYLVYAKSATQSILNVLILQQSRDGYDLVQQLQSNGTSFDMVEYAQMDDRPGLELILGNQLSESLPCNAEVYTFSEELNPDMLLSVRYADFLVPDLNQDQVSELFLLKSGTKETDLGVAELYRMESGALNRSNSVKLSAPAENLRRVITGCIHGGIPAVFAATAADDLSLISDVYILQNDELINLTVLGESESSIRTLRSQYVYAEDIDNDGVVELPYLLPMMPMDDMVSGGKQELIRWYAMKPDGEEIVKAYTFHNFIDSWYLQLREDWAHRLTVVSKPGAYEFYIWDENFESAEKVLTIFESVGNSRRESSVDSSVILLHESASLRLTAQLEESAQRYDLSAASLKDNFHMIRQY